MLLFRPSNSITNHLRLLSLYPSLMFSLLLTGRPSSAQHPDLPNHHHEPPFALHHQIQPRHQPVIHPRLVRAGHAAHRGQRSGVQRGRERGRSGGERVGKVLEGVDERFGRFRREFGEEEERWWVWRRGWGGEEGEVLRGWTGEGWEELSCRRLTDRAACGSIDRGDPSKGSKRFFFSF